MSTMPVIPALDCIRRDVDHCARCSRCAFYSQKDDMCRRHLIAERALNLINEQANKINELIMEDKDDDRRSAGQAGRA